MNGKYKNEQEDVIDLSIIFGVLLKNIPLLVIMMVLGAAAAFSYTKYLIPERYRAEATVIVNNKINDSQYISQGDLSSAKNLAELYSIIIKSDTVLDKIINDMGDRTSYSELRNSVSVTTVSETQVVTISMTSTNPEHAKEVVEKFVKYSKPVIMDKVDAGSVKELNEAALANNGNPVSPNKKKNTMIGAFGGLVLAAAIVILKELFNTTLKTEADVKSVLDVPLLGVIPKVDRKEFNK